VKISAPGVPRSGASKFGREGPCAGPGLSLRVQVTGLGTCYLEHATFVEFAGRG